MICRLFVVFFSRRTFPTDIMHIVHRIEEIIAAFGAAINMGVEFSAISAYVKRISAFVASLDYIWPIFSAQFASFVVLKAGFAYDILVVHTDAMPSVSVIVIIAAVRTEESEFIEAFFADGYAISHVDNFPALYMLSADGTFFVCSLCAIKAQDGIIGAFYKLFDWKFFPAAGTFC